jgi:isopenicillin N synthase-like dioxygenase
MAKTAPAEPGMNHSSTRGGNAMGSSIPIIDIHPFTAGDDEDRRKLARAVDAACRDVGFLIVTGHGIPQELLDRAHAAAWRFFDLDEATKQRYVPPPRARDRGAPAGCHVR